MSTPGIIREARIFVVDDEPGNVLLLEKMLHHAGYRSVFTTTDSRQVLTLCEAYQPDLLLLDLMMPFRSGHQIIEDLYARDTDTGYFPILVLTADVSPESRQRALAAGAKDFLTKPFDHAEVLLRVKNLLETRYLYLQLRNQNQNLEEKVRERTDQLERTNDDLARSQHEILERLARAAEFRDDDTGQHTQRVSRTAALLAQQLGLECNHVELIRSAAPLHDAGKIGISDTILLKPSSLTPAEIEIMKTHVPIGAALLAEGHSPLMQTAEIIARTHHERWDGTGYPEGLCGTAIPIEGRILAVADVFDALTHERPYKAAWSIGDAVAEIDRQRGYQFDSTVVNAFMQLPHNFLV
jgi:putative two-component system response regulator